ncbi:MAG TPA: toll/interleukin-1 receptor domain-containing protein [Paraburkholderia sp.]|jgi:hypothetical protein|nr:toll/interleukin-1 receptor domain-containing protein [Paraburkholderia sp.]
MGYDAFISFSSKDSILADKLRQGLELRGLSCWISSRDVAPGADFGDSIVKALETSTVMVLVFSTNANNSDEVKKELVLAGEYKMPVLPVRIENVLPFGAFRYQLTIRQYLDLFEDWDTNLAKLADQVKRMVESQIAFMREMSPDATQAVDDVAHTPIQQVPPPAARQPEAAQPGAPLQLVPTAVVPLGTRTRERRLSRIVPVAVGMCVVLVIAGIAAAKLLGHAEPPPVLAVSQVPTPATLPAPAASQAPATAPAPAPAPTATPALVQTPPPASAPAPVVSQAPAQVSKPTPRIATTTGNSTPPTPRVAAAQDGNVAGAAKPDLDGHVDQVLDSGALIVSGKIVNLFAIRGDDGRPAQAMQRYLKSKGSHIQCFAKGTAYQCLANGEDVAEHAVRNGWARARDGAPADYAAAEQEARRAHAGVWAM